MGRMKLLFFLPMLIGMLYLAGCSSTRLVTSWRDDGYRGGGLKKPLVLAIAEKQVVRFKVEDEFVQALHGRGVDALQSYKIFPELKGLDADAIRAKLPDNGRDSILVTHLVDVKKETVYVPERTDVYPTDGYARPGYYNHFGSYYAQSYSVVTTPGYSYESRIYVLETNLYDAGTGKLVWTVTTDTEDPSSFESALKDFVGVIMKDVQKNSLF